MHGVRRVNPTPDSFVASFKALLVNTAGSRLSPHANCEEDAATTIIDDLDAFFNDRDGTRSTSEQVWRLIYI